MRYLSLEWIEAMQAEVAASESLATLAQSMSIGVTQVVTDGPEGTVVYHLQVGDGVAPLVAEAAAVAEAAGDDELAGLGEAAAEEDAPTLAEAAPEGDGDCGGDHDHEGC